MKLLGQVLDSSIHQMVNIDEMQFAFMPGRGPTDAIFNVCQLQEKYIAAANKQLDFAFVDLEKAFDRVTKRSCGGPWGVWVWTNKLCVSSRVCTTMSRAVCRSMVNTVMSWVWELVCIRALSLAHCSSSWCYKRRHVSSALVCHGSSSMLMTWCPSQTPRSVSPSSWHGRLAWKVKGFVLTWRKPSSWTPLLTWMSYRNQSSIPVLSAARVSATTPLSACSASYGSTRGCDNPTTNWPYQGHKIPYLVPRTTNCLPALWPDSDSRAHSPGMYSVATKSWWVLHSWLIEDTLSDDPGGLHNRISERSWILLSDMNSQISNTTLYQISHQLTTFSSWINPHYWTPPLEFVYRA